MKTLKRLKFSDCIFSVFNGFMVDVGFLQQSHKCL